MKSILYLFAITLVSLPVFAQRSTRVRTYVKKDGAVVQSHRRTTPDRSFNNNWSTKPNVNPYTGATGTRTTKPSRSR